MSVLLRIKGPLKTNSPAIIVLANVFASGLALISAPIVARAIGPTGRGVTAAAVAAFAILPIILAMGMPLEVRRLSAITDGTAATRTVRDLWLVAVVPSIAVAYCVNFFVFGTLDHTTRVIAFVGLSLAPLTMSWLTDLSVLLARGRYRAVFLMRVIQPAIYLVVVTLAWAFDIATVNLVLVASIVGNAMTTVIGLSLVRVSPRGPRLRHRGILRQGVTFAGSTAAEAATNRLDQILLLPLIGSYQAGLYSVATTIAVLPLAIGHALGASYFRDVAASHASKRATLKASAVRSTAALAFCACAALGAATQLLVPMVFGQEFIQAIPSVFIALVGSFAMLVSFVVSLCLTADSRGWWMTGAQTVSLIVAIGLLYLFAPQIGSAGAALASSASYVLLMVLLVVGLKLPVSALLPTFRDLEVGVRRLFK